LGFKISRLLLALVLLPLLAQAQGPSSAQIEANKGNLKRVNVADLANANQSLMYRVLDGASASDCTSGGGSTQVVCYWDGTAWVAASGASGSGDVTAVGDCASGACFNGTQGTTLTFNNAGGDATFDYDGTDFSFSKLIVALGATLSGGTATLGTVAGAVDAGGATSLEVPNGAAPTVDAFGEIAGDNDLWAASRGAPVFFDGTASTALVNVLVSDAPANGECPKWNTGGTITWESCAGGGVTIGDTQVAYATAANTLGGDAGMTYNAATDTITLAGDGVFSGGDVTLGAAGTATTINSSYTGTAGFVHNSATAASGGVDIGFNFVVAGNLGTADRVMCIGDNADTTCGLGYVDGGGNTNFTGSGTFGSSVSAGASTNFIWTGRTRMNSSANGKLKAENSAASAGINFQFTAAPTIASGFGTTPSIAGTDSAGRVTVGSGGTDVTGTVTFAATWSTAPACVCNNEVTTLLCKATASTTTLILTSATAFTAADTLTYICVGY
jgi:hypothetical protein